MKINLKKLYAELANTDVRKGYNASVMETEVAISALGKRLRSESAEEATAIIAAIVERAGKSNK